MTLLHMAAEGGHLNIVEYLVGKGANKNVENLSKVSIRDCTTKQIPTHRGRFCITLVP